MPTIRTHRARAPLAKPMTASAQDLGTALSPPRSAQAQPVKVAIMATHPIQYQVPWYQHLTAQPGVAPHVYYAVLPTRQQQGIGFGVSFAWDIPMFEGYGWSQLENRAGKPGLGSFFGANTPGIHAALAANRPDVAIITGWQAYTLLQGIWACMRLGIPMIVRAESNALRKRRWWVRILHKLLLSRFDACLAIGQANRQFYLGNGVAAAKIFSSHYFVDNQRIGAQYESLAPARASLRQAWGIAPDKTCFVFAGKLQEKKRIMDLLRALKLAGEKRADLHLLVVGSGEQLEAAQGLVASGRLPVTFAGFLNQTDMPKAYAAADCLVLPSDFGETWGLVVNEAMVCGLPAIVSDRVGCGPDLVSDGVTGLLFPFGDIEALAACLLKMAAEPEARAAMGARARDRIADYSVQQAVQGTLRAIHATTHRRAQQP